jgi:hypothetical protein
MFSTTSIIIFGIIIVIVAVLVWKLFKKPSSSGSSKKNEESSETDSQSNDIETGQDLQLTTPTSPPPMVFAINDNGYLDLTDMNGTMLDSKYGPNPKTYINLLDMASKDVTEMKTANDETIFKSNVGNTKLYQIAGNHYIINYTRLSDGLKPERT